MSNVYGTLDGDKPYDKYKTKTSSRVWLSAAVSRKVDPVPLLGSTIELNLLTEAWVSWPSGYDVATPLFCHGVGRTTERCPPPSPYHLWWERKLTLPAPRQHSRADLIDRSLGVFGTLPENISMGDLALPPICHMVVWVGKRGQPFSSSHCLRHVGELALGS